jgi:protocatechuate 3,4-dioxygenase alpha subunit
VKPSGREDAGTVHAPHFAVRVLARGILTEYLTRVYFDDEPDNARDEVLGLVPDERRATLIAVTGTPSEYHFDIVVQGARETVFFDV